MEHAGILVVEDEGLVALNLCKRLTQMGFSVVGQATSASEAVALAREKLPDLILMDIRLEGEKDGIDAAAEIRAWREIPIVFLTAFSDKHFLDRAKVTYPHGYLVKPFRENELRSTLTMALHKHQKEREERRQRAWSLSFVERAEHPVLVLDTENRLTFLNEAAARALGRPAEDCLGQSVADLTGLALGDPGGQPRLSGREGSAYPIHDEDQSPSGMLLEFRGEDPATTEQAEAPVSFLEAGFDEETRAILAEISGWLPRLVRVQAISPYCALTFDTPRGESREVRIALKTLEEAFTDNQLLRVHRSYMVRTERVLCTNLEANSCYVIWLKTKAGIQTVPVGRGYVSRLREAHPAWFNGNRVG